jgi:hypothetical protein
MLFGNLVAQMKINVYCWETYKNFQMMKIVKKLKDWVTVGKKLEVRLETLLL